MNDCLSYEELMAISANEMSSIKNKAGEREQCLYAFGLLFGQQDKPNFKGALPYLETASKNGSAIATLVLGLYYELSLGGVSNEDGVSLAISYYSKGYDIWNSISIDSKAASANGLEKWFASHFPKLRKQIVEIISIKDLCVYANDSFRFDWTEQTRKKLASLLPNLSISLHELEGFLNKQNATGDSDAEGELLFQAQDLLIMPAEVIKAAAGRDILLSFLVQNGYPAPKHTELLDRAMGRCLIDDDDKSDNDYIISGLRIVSGLSNDPIWQFRTGLWYEYDPESKDLDEAIHWYEKASPKLDLAVKGLSRIKAKEEYKLIHDPGFGNAEDCVKIAQGYHANMELSNAWNIRAAIRGDVSAMRKLEQMIEFSENKESEASSLNETIKKEIEKLALTESTWVSSIKVAQNKCMEIIAKKAKDAADAKKRAEEARRKAEEERIRKEKEEAEKERIRKLTPKQKFEEGKQLINGIDYAKGVELIKMASAEGLSDASKFLAFGFDYGEGGIIKKQNDAEKYYLLFLKQAKEQDADIPRVNYEIGRLYQSAEKKAFISYYEKAAELGHVKAMCELAFGYDFGNTGFPKDEKKALKYYLDFGKKGDKSYNDYKIALYNLGQMFFYGTHGAEIDKEKAIPYYKESAKLGYKKAQERLDEIDAEEKRLLEYAELDRIKRQEAARKNYIFFSAFSLLYLFFTIKAIVLLHPFWVLFWGVLCIVAYFLFSAIPTHSRWPYYSMMFPAAIMSVYFIIRANSLDHPFWIWFWAIFFCIIAALSIVCAKND